MGLHPSKVGWPCDLFGTACSVTIATHICTCIASLHWFVLTASTYPKSQKWRNERTRATVSVIADIALTRAELHNGELRDVIRTIQGRRRTRAQHVARVDKERVG